MTTETRAVAPDRLEEFVGRVVGELGATLNAALVVIGDKLGLYRAMAGAGPLQAYELADRTDTSERYVREWLNAQAAGGFVEYHAGDDRYELPPEQAVALADDSSPAFVAGAFQLVTAQIRDEGLITDAFRTGRGVGWHEHDHELFEGTERFFRPGYVGNLTTSWIPALEGVEEKLRSGARVADVGCGHGASTILMAQSYSASRFVGYDYHEASIEVARRRARAAGVDDRVTFEAVAATGLPSRGFDLVTTFDALHDMGDPVGASRRVLDCLDRDGTWMIVEPYAGDRIEDNLTPVGRVYYAASTLVCTPGALAQEGGLALGAQAGEKRLRDVVTAAGFTRFRRAAETPVNLVLEARL